MKYLVGNYNVQISLNITAPHLYPTKEKFQIFDKSFQKILTI